MKTAGALKFDNGNMIVLDCESGLWRGDIQAMRANKIANLGTVTPDMGEPVAYVINAVREQMGGEMQIYFSLQSDPDRVN